VIANGSERVAMRLLTQISMFVALSLCVAACAQVDNERPSTGDSTIALFEPADEPAPVLAPSSEKSVTHIDRSWWQPQVVVSGVGDVQHNPQYTNLEPVFTDGTMRQRGEFPYRASALDLGDGAGAQILEMLAAPFAACLDIALFIPRAIVNPPLAVNTSVGEPFERYDVEGLESPEPIPAPVKMDPVADVKEWFEYLRRRIRFEEGAAPWDITFMTFDYTGERKPDGTLGFREAAVVRTSLASYMAGLTGKTGDRRYFLERVKSKAGLAD